MRRREFLVRTATAAGAVWLSSQSIFKSLAGQTLSQKFSASDTVTLGSTGIKTSRLAMGTGTVGTGHHSHQTALGIQGLSDLLRNGYDHGLRFFDAADSYGSHPHIAEALKHVPRDKVTVLSKSWARDANGMRADLAVPAGGPGDRMDGRRPGGDANEDRRRRVAARRRRHRRDHPDDAGAARP